MCYDGFLSEIPDDMIECGFCHEMDWKTMVAHLMMCNYREGIASQAVVECIEDTMATLDPKSHEAVVATACYDPNLSDSLKDVAKKLFMPLPIFFAWRLQWLRRLASALLDADLLELSRPIINVVEYMCREELACSPLLCDSFSTTPEPLRQQADEDGLTAVLYALRKKRNATEYESKLYKKWVEHYGLTLRFILDAVDRLNGFPTFTNLDNYFRRVVFPTLPAKAAAIIEE